MTYRCANCGSMDSTQDWASSQLGEYYCEKCLQAGLDSPTPRAHKKPTSPEMLWLASVVLLASCFGGLLYYFFAHWK